MTSSSWNKLMNPEADYKNTHDEGARQRNAFTFVLTIKAGDVEAFLNNPAHEASMSGTVNCRLLSNKAISVLHVLAHCFGSATFVMALMYELKDVSSLVISPH